MKKYAILFVFSFTLLSCEKDNNNLLIGKWKLIEGYNLMVPGGIYNVPPQEQRIEQYTKDHLKILYDFEGNEIARSNYKATETTVTVNGVNEDGKEWSFSHDYWLSHDTLTIKQDGGFEFYLEYFIRLE